MMSGQKAHPPQGNEWPPQHYPPRYQEQWLRPPPQQQQQQRQPQPQQRQWDHPQQPKQQQRRQQQQQQQQQQQPARDRRGGGENSRDRSRPGRFTILRRQRAMAKRSEVGICTKYILFFENFVLFLVGLAVLAVGSYILALKEKKVHDPLDFFLDPACVMCLGGALIFVLAFLGCTGALRENTCFLKVFHHTLSLFLLLELGVAVCFFLTYYVDDVRNALFPSDAFSKAIVNYRDDRDMQDLIDSLQRSLGCCGLSDSDTGYKDWNQNIYFNCTQDSKSPERCSVPPSCCKMQPGQTLNLYCGANIYTFQNGKRLVGDTSKIYTDGCLKALADWVNENSLVLGGVLLGILLPQIFIICLSRNLIDMVNRQKSKWNRR